MSRCIRAALVALGVLVMGAAGAAGGGTVAFGADEPIAVDPSAAGSIVVGPSGQVIGQSQETQQSNGQRVDPTSGTIVGGTQQASGQQSATKQAIDQTQSGTFVVFGGGLHQRANQAARTAQGNDQSVDGSTILGNVDQSNDQAAAIDQAIHQSLTGTFVVFGGTLPVDPGVAQSFTSLGRCAVCSNALSDSSVGLAGGDLRQSAGSRQSVAGTYVVLGNLDQSFSQSSRIDESNDQTVSGNIIIGNVSQANAQHAAIGQSIDQSLSGTFVVFGSLDQSADQLALINQLNHQKIQGG